MKTFRHGLVVAFVVLAGVGCGRSESAAKGPLPQSALDEYRHCESDEQCTWVNNGCCDCANGGEDVAVAVDKKDEFRARFDCSNTPCTLRGAVPACGTGTAVCEAGLCVFNAER